MSPSRARSLSVAAWHLVHSQVPDGDGPHGDATGRAARCCITTTPSTATPRGTVDMPVDTIRTATTADTTRTAMRVISIATTSTAETSTATRAETSTGM